MAWIRQGKKGLVGLCLVAASSLFSQSWPNITITVQVPVVFGVLPPAVPGDPPDSRYESTLGDVSLSADGGPPGQGGTVWYVTVQKSGTGWPGGVTLAVRRDPTRDDVRDGVTYVAIPDAPLSAYFFRSNNRRRVTHLGLQHRAEIATLPPMGSYGTAVTYTIFLGVPP